jgi:hypothetical protein
VYSKKKTHQQKNFNLHSWTPNYLFANDNGFGSIRKWAETLIIMEKVVSLLTVADAQFRFTFVTHEMRPQLRKPGARVFILLIFAALSLWAFVQFPALQTRRRGLPRFLGSTAPVNSVTQQRIPSTAREMTPQQGTVPVAPSITEAAASNIDIQNDQRHRGESIDAYLRRRAVDERVMIVPTNQAYVPFAINLMCTLRRAQSALRVTFAAMDAAAHAQLDAIGLPVFMDDAAPPVPSNAASWGDSAFHRMVCTKLGPVLRALRSNLTVVLADADIAFVQAPDTFIAPEGLDAVFSIGSCHKDLPDNFDLAGGDGVAKLNTGFYVAQARPNVVALWEHAYRRCRQSGQSGAQGAEIEGDQPAMNGALMTARRGGGPSINYGFFDGCLFANGCVYFKHLCANEAAVDPRTASGRDALSRGSKLPTLKPIQGEAPPGYLRRDSPVLVHANYVVGRKNKLKHLKKYKLWDEECVASYLKVANVSL